MLGGSQVRLAVGGELGNTVAQRVDGDRGADCQGGLVDPLPGQRRDGPGADQGAAVPVGEQAEGAGGMGFVGPGTGDGLGQVQLGGGDGDAAVASLGGGQPNPDTAAVSSSVPRSPSDVWSSGNRNTPMNAPNLPMPAEIPCPVARIATG